MHTHVSVILHTLGCRVCVLSALLSTLDCGRVSHQPAVSMWPGAQRRFGPVLFAVWDGLLAHHLSARPPSHTSHYVLSRSLSWEQAASLFANVNSAERLRGMGDRKQAEPPRCHHFVLALPQQMVGFRKCLPVSEKPNCINQP